MNIDNINRVIEQLELEKAARRKSFVMGSFAQYIDEDKVPEGEYGRFHSCNTALCIAGWSNALRLTSVGQGRKTFFDAAENDNAARRWLGLNSQQADELFYMLRYYLGSDHHIGSNFDRLPAQLRYDAGIKVLQILRETGEVDWKRAVDCAQKASRRRRTRKPTGASV